MPDLRTLLSQHGEQSIVKLLRAVAAAQVSIKAKLVAAGRNGAIREGYLFTRFGP